MSIEKLPGNPYNILKTFARGMYLKINELIERVNGNVPEAPNDGTQYGRQSESWTAITHTPPGVPEAPTDGQLYGRKDAAWNVVPGAGALIWQSESTAAGDTTISTTPVQFAGMSIIPPAGFYLVWFDTTIANDTNNETNTIGIYIDATLSNNGQVNTSLINALDTLPASIHNLVQVNGAQAINIKWNVSAGTGTAGQKRFSILKVS